MFQLSLLILTAPVKKLVFFGHSYIHYTV